MANPFEIGVVNALGWPNICFAPSTEPDAVNTPKPFSAAGEDAKELKLKPATPADCPKTWKPELCVSIPANPIFVGTPNPLVVAKGFTSDVLSFEGIPNPLVTAKGFACTSDAPSLVGMPNPLDFESNDLSA
jgi:hypothetical protein